MKRAVITGFVTGIIISVVLIAATYVRPLLPDTFTANLVFTAFFFFSIVGVLWSSLGYFSRASEVKWMTLNITGIISSLIAAIIVRTSAQPLGFAVYKFMDLAIVLFLISVSIAGIYYVRNRNRVPDHITSKNEELIF